VRRLAPLAALSALCALPLPGCAEDAPAAWVAVRRGDLVIGAEVTGALRAVDSTPIKPPPIRDKWDFKIAQMADEGITVKQGDVVVAFDGFEMMQLLEQLENDADAVEAELDKRVADAAMARKDEELKISEAEANLRKATLKAEQPEELTASLDAATAEIDRRIAEIDRDHARASAQAARAHDRAAIRSLREKLAYFQGRVREVQASIGRMQVAAPRAGTVLHPTNWRGEKKKVGDAAWRMETVVEIVSLDEMVGEGEVDEVDASRVREGQRVTLRLDAQADRELVGVVSEIANTVQRRSFADPSRVVRLTVEIEDDGEVPLRPGMRFRGLVETEVAKDVVIVPAEAVFVTADGPVAYRRTGDGHERVRLEIGRRSASEVEVLEGLEAGDQVSRVDLGEAP